MLERRDGEVAVRHRGPGLLGLPGLRGVFIRRRAQRGSLRPHGLRHGRRGVAQHDAAEAGKKRGGPQHVAAHGRRDAREVVVADGFRESIRLGARLRIHGLRLHDGLVGLGVGRVERESHRAEGAPSRRRKALRNQLRGSGRVERAVAGPQIAIDIVARAEHPPAGTQVCRDDGVLRLGGFPLLDRSVRVPGHRKEVVGRGGELLHLAQLGVLVGRERERFAGGQIDGAEPARQVVAAAHGLGRGDVRGALERGRGELGVAPRDDGRQGHVSHAWDRMRQVVRRRGLQDLAGRRGVLRGDAIQDAGPLQVDGAFQRTPGGAGIQLRHERLDLRVAGQESVLRPSFDGGSVGLGHHLVRIPERELLLAQLDILAGGHQVVLRRRRGIAEQHIVHPQIGLAVGAQLLDAGRHGGFGSGRAGLALHLHEAGQPVGDFFAGLPEIWVPGAAVGKCVALCHLRSPMKAAA